MAGATMGGAGKGGGTIYDPREKAKANHGKGGYYAAVQADLNKQAAARAKGKSGNSKKVGR
jgi:hypothetical protein